jgi:F-type H+-transporting ATPase subunit a
MLEQETEATAHGTASGAAAGDDTGTRILGHILDSNEIEIPFTHATIELPVLHVGPWELPITKHVVMMWIAGLLVFLLLRAAVRRANEPVPHGLRNALETLIVFIRDEVARKSIPHGSERFTGYLLTTFFFILSMNLLGLVPFMATPTGNISVTAALAIMAFLVIQVGGIREYGPIKHFGNLVPPGLPAWLAPLMFVLELLSMFIKPFALCIRLFANMMAGHVVILAFISLIFILGIFAAPVAVGFAVFVYFLEILVAFIQAYIFTMLTAQFIGMSVHPAH